MRGSPPRDPDLKVERGRWICVEQMVKMNDVGDTNGEQALWIDGKLVSHLGKGLRWGADGREEPQVPEGGAPFEGFRWRTVKELNINYVWIYVYTQKPAGHRIKVWFDDVIVARTYIGPLARE